MSLTTAIINFWFEGVDDSTKIQKKQMPFRKWFRSTTEMDADIRNQFQEHHRQLLKHPVIANTAIDRLAQIILCDQLSRNMYRNTPAAYQSDPLAQKIAIDLIESKEDQILCLIHRIFAYMPLMHAENLDLQCLSVQKFEELLHESRTKYPENAAYYQSQYDHARTFFQIIKRFGRFPRRNKVLSRQSTTEEVEFLA